MARAIEERFFREQFHREWIVAVVPPEGQFIGMLLAVDGDQRIVGETVPRAGPSCWMIGRCRPVSAYGNSSNEISISSDAKPEQISTRRS